MKLGQQSISQLEFKKNRLSNGYIPALACGPLKRQRYINDRMEIELENFKIEVARRFKNSKITEFQFPRALNKSGSNSPVEDYRAKPTLKYK